MGSAKSCGILIVVNANGTANVYADSSVFPYDGESFPPDDVLVGVQNNSNATITSLPLNGGSNSIFAFEGDGICDPAVGDVGPRPSGCPFGQYGYEGPGVTFTGINGSFASCTSNGGSTWQCASDINALYTAGTVNFTPGIPPNGSRYFGLEAPLSASEIVVPLNTSCPATPANVNQFYSSQLVGTGGNGAYTWTVLNGSLAPLKLSSTGLVSGTPNVVTTLSFTLRITSPVTEGNPLTADQPCTIVVQPSLAISCIFPVATAGVPYSATCDAVGGKPPYTWTAPGPQTSWLTGTPSAGGGATITFAGTPPSPPPSSYSFTVTVTDSTSPTQSKSQPVTIDVGLTLTINCPVPAPATGGKTYSTSCSASGGTPPYRWTYSGAGTSWLTGNPNGTTATLNGTPPNPPPSSYALIVAVTDSSAPAQTKSQTIVISVGSTLTITCTAATTATVGTVYSGNCIGSGGTPPYSWTYSGAPWISGPATGPAVAFAGTPPNPPASYPFTVTVTDSTSPTKVSKSQTITISVSPPPIQATITQNNSGAAPNQTNLLVQFGQAAATNYTGTISLSFKPDASVTNVPATYLDPAGGFPGGAQGTNQLAQNFSVNQGQTQASVQFGQGTVAGTWTVTLTALNPGGVPSPAPSYTVQIAPVPPAITAGSVKIVFNSTNTGFTVQLSGFATTREVTSATLVFSPAGSGQLTGTSVTVPFNGQDQIQWFNTDSGRNAGGTFSLALPFAYTGDPNVLGSVAVTLTNSKGTSAAVTGTK